MPEEQGETRIQLRVLCSHGLTIVTLLARSRARRAGQGRAKEGPENSLKANFNSKPHDASFTLNSMLHSILHVQHGSLDTRNFGLGVDKWPHHTAGKKLTSALPPPAPERKRMRRCMYRGGRWACA